MGCISKKVVVASTVIFWVGLANAIVPNKLVSGGLPAHTGAATTDYLTDGYLTNWKSSSAKEIALNVGEGPTKLRINWESYGDCAWATDFTSGCGHSGVALSNFKILTSANSTDGKDGDWVEAASVKNNPVMARGVDIDFAGKSWFKFVSEGDVGQILEIEAFDMSAGGTDTWFFMGSTMYVAVFALTEEEYNLRHAGTPSDNPKLNDLLEPIFTQRPKDRLLMALQVEGGNRRPLEFRNQADTVDDFAYPKYRRERLIRYVRSLDRVWMTRALGGRYPGLDARGGARVFDSASKALDDIRVNAALKMSSQSYTRAEFEQEARSWYGLGIPRFLLNPGRQGITGEIPRDSFVPDPVYRDFDIYGSDLTHQILRFAEFRFQLENGCKDAQAMTMTLWDYLCHTLPNTPLLVPVAYDGDPVNDVEDSELHMTAGAYEALTRAELRRQTGKAPAEGKYVAEDADGHPVNIAKIELFYGSEGYRVESGKMLAVS